MKAASGAGARVAGPASLRPGRPLRSSARAPDACARRAVRAAPRLRRPDLGCKSSSDRAAERANGIAEPRSGFSALWKKYEEVLEAYPIRTKAVTTTVGMGLGDLIAQIPLGVFDPLRFLRQALFGLVLSGPIGHFWYLWLDKTVMPERPQEGPVVALKVALDQFLWSPAFTCVFYSWFCIFTGQADQIVPTIQSKLLPTMLANWTLWPIAHVINFKFVPSNQRMLYVNVVNVLWNVYLSTVANSPDLGDVAHKVCVTVTHNHCPF
ncbi:unnamed protein product [Pedinophyceae sp. YPF-701]|nr:unnamed protein product [Pedinophyceae sp. YPF-701]